MPTQLLSRISLFAGICILVSCSVPASPTGTAAIIETAPALPSAAPTVPRPTPEPVAAMVNGQAITMAEFDHEVKRFEAAQEELGIDLATLGDYRSQVLQAMIDRLLLAQQAAERGIMVQDSNLALRLEDLIAEAGGEQAFNLWLETNNFTLEEFQAILAKEVLAAQMLEQIAEDVPRSIQQAHARHILVSSLNEAQQIRRRIIAGADFAEMAWAFSLDASTRLAGGDLGWFPAGFLTVPEVEEAAFSLPPGEISQPIESSLGFHIIEVLERGLHSLSPQAFEMQRDLAVENWLASQRETAEIEIFLSP